MSSNYWQTRKQAEQFSYGNSLTSRIASYIETWERRCYLTGIPDSLPPKVASSGRAPCYKMLATAILRNDFTLKCLGFSGPMSEYYEGLRAAKAEPSPQLDWLKQ
jgi:predicted phosphoadenosine phosphosulfate sulfurtransferase